MKYKDKLTYLNALLNILLVALILPFIAMFFLPFMEDMNINLYLQFFIGLIFAGSYILIIFTLKKVLGLIRNRDPFNPKNIVYLKRIGYYILIVGIMYGIISYPMINNSNFDILATSYGSLKPTFFLHILLSLLSFIFSDIFKMAMEIKNENDLTV